MTVYIEKPEINLREALASAAGSPTPPVETFWFSGDSTKTDFPLPRGWKPTAVYADGLLKRPGSAEDYTVAFDGFIYTVSFAVAPAAVDVALVAAREV